MTPAQAVQALKDANGNKSLAARNCGVSRNTLLWNLELAAREVLKFPKRENLNVPPEITEYINNAKNAKLATVRQSSELLHTNHATNGAIDPNTRSTLCHVRPNPRKFDKPVTHCVIPDVQAKPRVPLDHLRWAGEYIAEKRPDVIVQIGDFCDFESLSSYDRGKKSAENKRYKADLEAAHKAMELLMTPIVKAKDYHPRLVLTLGNHEDRLNRFIDDNAALDGAMSMSDLGYEAWGWEVVPFLKPVVIDGVSYCHYFYQPNTGKPYGGSNLETRLKTIGHSFTMGHQQGLLTAIRDLSNGTRQRGLVAGSFYQHFESYRSHQANSHWQGIIFKHQVAQGNYDLMELSLDFLRRRYA